MKKKSTSILVVIASLLSSSAASQELKPLAKILSGSFEKSYVPVRCSGLFMSMAKWGGVTALGEDTYYQSLATAAQFARIGSELRAESTGDAEDVSYQKVINDAVQIAEIYLKTFQDNYVSNGSAWTSDDDFISDLDICSKLAKGS